MPRRERTHAASEVERYVPRLMSIAYVVRIVCETEEHRGRVERWLLDGHLAELRRAGAQAAALIRFDDVPLTLEAHYRFENREAFAAYEQGDAPRVRAESRTLFPEGVRFERRLGDVLGDR